MSERNWEVMKDTGIEQFIDVEALVEDAGKDRLEPVAVLCFRREGEGGTSRVYRCIPLIALAQIMRDHIEAIVSGAVSERPEGESY